MRVWDSRVQHLYLRLFQIKSLCLATFLSFALCFQQTDHIIIMPLCKTGNFFSVLWHQTVYRQWSLNVLLFQMQACDFSRCQCKSREQNNNLKFCIWSFDHMLECRCIFPHALAVSNTVFFPTHMFIKWVMKSLQAGVRGCTQAQRCFETGFQSHFWYADVVRISSPCSLCWFAKRCRFKLDTNYSKGWWVNLL